MRCSGGRESRVLAIGAAAVFASALLLTHSAAIAAYVTASALLLSAFVYQPPWLRRVLFAVPLSALLLLSAARSPDVATATLVGTYFASAASYAEAKSAYRDAVARRRPATDYAAHAAAFILNMIAFVASIAVLLK